MTLTVATGLFGHRPAAVFSRELPEMAGFFFLEPSPRRIRGIAAGQTVVDSRAASLLFDHGRLPRYLFPQEDVRMELLEESARRTPTPTKGEARWWHLRLDDELREDAAWDYPEPPPGSPPLPGLICFRWDAMDEWFEEDEENIVHARDPYHRVDVLDTTRRVRVGLDGQVLAETTHCKVLFETSLPPRWYIPREDVSAELLDSDFGTACAYKGVATHNSVRVGDRVEEHLVWRYPEPRREVEPIRDHLAFYNERVDLEIDGELQQRPMTPFHPDWPGPPVDSRLPEP